MADDLPSEQVGVRLCNERFSHFADFSLILALHLVIRFGSGESDSTGK